jgi:hypothetical protein
MSMTENAAHLRRQILDLSHEYFAEAFPVAEFKPGQSPVPVSGKVIDGGDLSSVIDSALDCWFTSSSASWLALLASAARLWSTPVRLPTFLP